MIAVAALAASTSVALMLGPRRTPGQRLSSLHRAGMSESARRQPLTAPERVSRVGSAWFRRLVAAAALLAGMALLGPALGLISGGAVAAVVTLMTPGLSAVALDGADIALVADLVASCLAAGTLLPDAVAAAGMGAGGAIEELCQVVVASLRAGAQPEQAWDGWLADPRLAPIARTAVRTAHSGAATADELRRTAARLRVQRRSGLQRRVQQASIWVVVPLGLCFLPAFVLVAVVPLVAGLLPSLS